VRTIVCLRLIKPFQSGAVFPFFRMSFVEADGYLGGSHLVAHFWKPDTEGKRKWHAKMQS